MILKTSENIKIYYKIDGNGPPIIFLNALFSDLSLWDNTISEMKKSYTCIRYDIRGLGKSEYWLGKYSFDIHIKDLFELIKKLKFGDKYIFIGTCFGGMIATKLAIDYPDFVDRIIVNGIQILKSEKQKQVYLSWKEIIKNGGMNLFYKNVLPILMSNNYFDHNYKKIDEIIKVKSKIISKQMALKLINPLLHYGYHSNQIKQNKIPALLISGNEDGFSSPYEGKKISHYWKNSTHKIFKNCGHFPQIDCFDKYIKTIKFFINKKEEDEK